MAFLVLTRRLNEEIKIGDDITVKVVGISGSQIKLGIQAPVDLAISRPEKHEKPQDKN